jgi:hypothetical protein
MQHTHTHTHAHTCSDWKDPDAVFLFTVMDKDRYGSDDFEGEVEIGVLELLKLAEVRDRCKLFKVNLALKVRPVAKLRGGCILWLCVRFSLCFVVAPM